MHLTVIGSGDAFGSGGRANTCFRLKTAKSTLMIDCGATTMVRLRQMDIDPNGFDAIVLSHMHHDHFGGIPFFLLEGQLLKVRQKPLLIAGPPGARERIEGMMEAGFPKSTTNRWKFEWSVQEIPLDTETDVLGHTVLTTEVIHRSGTPSTALRIEDGSKVFAYSGDTEWTDALLPIAKNADLFICECYGYDGRLSGHMTWEVLKPKLGVLGARRIMLTHMNDTMLARLEEIAAGGVLTAADGLELNL